MTLKVVCFSLRKTVLSQIINMSIVDLYSEMLKEHKKIIDGHSEICKKNSLQCLISALSLIIGPGIVSNRFPMGNLEFFVQDVYCFIYEV